jgi:hypothetical protein
MRERARQIAADVLFPAAMGTDASDRVTAWPARLRRAGQAWTRQRRAR